MKIVIPGGSGHLGTIIGRDLERDGHEVVILSLGGKAPGAPVPGRFSIEVARAWEREVDAAEVPLTRKVKLRTAIVMSPFAGGPFDVLLNLTRHGLGGPAGDGRQYVSWIHYRD